MKSVITTVIPAGLIFGQPAIVMLENGPEQIVIVCELDSLAPHGGDK